MKHFSLATPGPDGDNVSDISTLPDGAIARTDAAALTQAVVFLQGTLKAKEEELARLYKEREVAIESKMQLVIEKTEMAMMLAQAQRERKDAIKELKLCKEEKAEMSRKMTQMEQKNEDAKPVISRAENIQAGMPKKEHLTDVHSNKGWTFEGKEELEKAIRSAIEEELKSAVVPCPAGGMPMDHNCNTGYFFITKNVKHGEELNCSHFACRNEGVKFRYFLHCKVPVEKRTFDEAMSQYLKNHVAGSISGNLPQEDELTEKVEEAENEVVNLDSKEEQSRTVEVPVWKKSGPKVVSSFSFNWVTDTLNYAPLKSGLFEWTLRVHELQRSTDAYLGVSSSSHDAPLNTAVGWFKTSWGCPGGGDTYYEGKRNGRQIPSYKSGSILHFFLDLTRDGSLSVSVDGKPQVLVASKMKSEIDECDGFLPTISCYKGAKIELLKFKRLLEE